MKLPRVGPLLWVAFICVVCLLFLTAEFLVPRVISAAYSGDSLEFLNRIVSGRAEHPLEHFVGTWHTVSRRALGGLVLVGLVAWLWEWRFARFAQLTLSRKPAVEPSSVLWLAAWFGALAGFSEAGHSVIRHLFERHPARLFAWETAWMAPLSAIPAFLLVALALLGFSRIAAPGRNWRSPISLTLVVYVYSGLVTYGFLQSPRFRLAEYAVLLLSLGAGATAARISGKFSRSFQHLVRKSATGVAVLLLGVTTAGLLTLPGPVESRRLARLGPAPESPNVLLIILDTVRAASMSLHGYERLTTPNLDGFAERGVVFDRALATAPWTLPSHASLFTGRYHFEVSADIGIPLDDEDPVLAEVLRDAGYATAAFVANYAYTTEASGLNRGFARYEDFPITAGSFIHSSWSSRTIFGRFSWFERPRTRKTADRVTSSFLDWQAAFADRPFFAFLNYMDAHSPYTSEPPFRGKFNSPGQPAKLTDKKEDVSKAELSGSQAAYDAAIAYTDHHLGRLFTELERRSVLNNTIVVVTSDHGEQFGEHGLMDHGNSLYMPLLHVPLVVVFPESVPGLVRVDIPVSIVDIPATVLELVGISALSGQPLSPLWRPLVPESYSPSPVLSEVSYWGVEDGMIKPWDPVFRGAMKSLFVDRWHLIRNGDGIEELYHIGTDPDELANLAASEGSLEKLNSIRSSLVSLTIAR